MKLNAEDVAPQDGNPRGKQLELFTHTKGNIAGVSPNIQGVFKSLLIKVQRRNTAYLLMCEFPDIVTVTLTIKQSKP